jgi:3-oxo-5-alpha-steroid 4-dehydrogenase 1
LLYAVGLLINLDSDSRLRQLRSKKNTKDSSDLNKTTDEGSKKSRYSIPRGGLLEYVSAANYFGEICEWWGYALAANLNPSAVWFAGFTTIFLGLRGIDNHRYIILVAISIV